MGATTMARAGMVCSGALALAVAACAPHGDLAGAGANRPDASRDSAGAPAGAPLPTGASIAAMSELYARPRLGATAAAGASSWVAPAPPPAFVVSSPLPPGDPPAPPLAAVANRQPDSPAPAASPPAANPASARSASAVDLAKGRQLFADYGCGGCHALADAGGTGGVGPMLDHNTRMTQDYVVGAISEGRGAMPAFRDQMTAGEIATLAAYIVQSARK